MKEIVSMKFRMSKLLSGDMEPRLCQFCAQDKIEIFPRIKRVSEGEYLGYWVVSCKRCKTAVISSLLVDAVIGWNDPIAQEYNGGIRTAS